MREDRRCLLGALLLVALGVGLVAATPGIAHTDASGEELATDRAQMDGVELHAVSQVGTQQTAPVGFESEPLDLGGVEVGETTSGDAVVQTSDGNVTEVYVEKASSEFDAQLRFPDGGAGSDTVAIGAGGEGTLQWAVDVDTGVTRQTPLTWEVELTPVYDDGSSGATRTVQVDATAVDGEIGDVTVSEPFSFDEPRDEVSQIEQTIPIEVENVGSGTLELDSASATSSEYNIEVVDTRVPDEVAPESTGVVEVDVAADTQYDPGVYNFDALVTDSSGQTESYADGLEIVHEAQLHVSSERLTIGDVPIGESETRSVTISETLGYKGVGDLRLVQTSGPNSWLQLDETPTSIAAGESDSTVVQVGFDTAASIGETYQWTYSIEGGGAEATQLTVDATAIPLDLEPIRDELGAYQSAAGSRGDIASETLTLVDQVDEASRQGDASSDEITTMLTLGDTTATYLEATAEAETRMSDDRYDAAQSELVRAAVAYNTMTVLIDELETAAYEPRTERIVDDGAAELDEMLAEQRAYYNDVLESGETSLHEEATVNRELARIARLQGNDEQADSLEAEANDAFESYRGAVSDGENHHANATAAMAELETESFTTVAGYSLVLNPAAYDSFERSETTIENEYDSAIASLAEAGEQSRVEEIRSERESTRSTLEIARYSLLASGVGLLLLVGLVTVHVGRGMYWYVTDSNEAVSGDFLV